MSWTLRLSPALRAEGSDNFNPRASLAKPRFALGFMPPPASQAEENMSLKESSDELNPPELVDERVSRASPARGPVDYLALAIATFGVGLLPLAPGTWGSVVGVGIYLLLRYFALNLGQFPFLALQLVVILAIIFAGIWAATQTERLSGRKDPGKVVVDEVAGQMISLLPLVLVPASAWSTWVIVSFTLFRFFDIVKPYPAKRMERLHGGLGIMCDDLVAGIYAAVIILMAIAVL